MFDREEELDRYLDEIKDMLRRKQYAAVRDLLLPLEPPDIAMLLEEAGEEFICLEDEKLARQNASVVQSVYRNLAERVGTDAWSLYQQFKINIPGAATDTRGRARGVSSPRSVFWPS